MLRSITTLIGRLLLGVVLIAHGWQKLDTWGPSKTTEAFEGMGVPMPDITSQVATWVELAGGVLIILGLLVRFVGPLVFVVMVGAAYYAGHRGIFASDGGWELEAMIGAAALFLAAAGAGVLSLDHLIMSPFKKRKAEKAAAATTMTSTAPYVAPTTTTTTTTPTTDFSSTDLPNTDLPNTEYGTGRQL